MSLALTHQKEGRIAKPLDTPFPELLTINQRRAFQTSRRKTKLKPFLIHSLVTII